MLVSFFDFGVYIGVNIILFVYVLILGFIYFVLRFVVRWNWIVLLLDWWGVFIIVDRFLRIIC